MNPNNKPRPRLLHLAVVAALLGAATPAAQAATKTWNCTASYWDYADCWSPGGVPLLVDNVIVGPVSATNTLLWFDSVTDTQSVNSLMVNSTTTNTIGFLQSGGSLTITSDEDVGFTGTGSFREDASLMCLTPAAGPQARHR